MPFDAMPLIYYFIGAYMIDRILHSRLEIRRFSSCVEKYFTCSLSSLEKYFSTLKEKFCISVWPYDILYVLNSLENSLVY